MKTLHLSTATDITLAVRIWGDDNILAPTLVMVHGFPDNSLVWQTVAEQLSTIFRVVAYDVRGAGDSTIPKATSTYKIRYLDWGAIQCWEAVTTPLLAGRVASFTSISGPSLDHAAYWMRQGLTQGSMDDKRKILNQLIHSWYIAAFHFPLASQLTWRVAFNKWPQMFSPIQALNLEDFPTQASDGHHGVKLYRANFIERLFKPQPRHTTVPIQLVIPTQDKFVTPALFDYLGQWASRVWRHEIDADHWVQLSHPAEVSAYIREFVDFIEAENS